jgi:hypothetical protein
MKKTRDKNTILETEMTDWMLSSVQKAQVGKTASGNAMLTTGGLTQHVKLPPNSIITEFNDAIRRTTSSPTKMMPFDQFHRMFEAFSVQHAESKPAAEPAASVAGASVAAKSAETTGSASKKPRRRRQTEGHLGHGHDGNSLTSSQEEDSHVTTRTRNSLIATDAPHTTHVEPTNLVKTLAEQDANFEAYLKLAQNQQETAKDGDTQAKMRNKLNASITAPRKIRKANPLGQTAINLIDSRGRASKDSKKGFGNIFQGTTALCFFFGMPSCALGLMCLVASELRTCLKKYCLLPHSNAVSLSVRVIQWCPPRMATTPRLTPPACPPRSGTCASTRTSASWARTTSWAASPGWVRIRRQCFICSWI